MRFPHPGGPGFGFAGTVVTDIVAGLVFIVAVIVVVGLLVVVVRFLLAATKAAELYVANNTPQDKSVSVEAPVTAPVVVTKPTPTRARTTKPPTA